MLTYYDWLNIPYSDFYNYLGETGQDQRTRDYILVSTEDDLPITVDEVLTHLKIDSENSEDTIYYELLIRAATKCAELMTRKEIINKQFKLFSNSLYDGLEIRRSPLVSVDSISVLNPTSNIFEPLDSGDYYYTQSSGYSKIYANPDKGWVYNSSARQQSCQVLFTVGCGNPSADSINSDIKLAILHHIAVLHEQRGDWGSADFEVGKLISNVPALPRHIYALNRLTNI